MAKPQPKLSHMPEQIKQIIMDRAPDLNTKIALGRVSKEFHVHLEKSPTNYAAAIISFYEGEVYVTLSAIFKEPDDSDSKMHNYVKFSAHNDGVLKRNIESHWEKVITGEEDYRKAAVQYALGIIGRKKITIDKLRLEYGGSSTDYSQKQSEKDGEVIMTEIERILNGLKRPLLVKALCLFVQVTAYQILQIPPYLMPGTLTYCKFSNSDISDPLYLTLISETEQWRCAKRMKIWGYDTFVSFEELLHFENVFMQVNELPVSAKTVLETFVNNPAMQSLSFICRNRFNLREFGECLQQFGVQAIKHTDIKISKNSEPNTYIELHYWSKGIFLARLPRKRYLSRKV